MGDLTKNLSRYEIKCKCGKCDFDTIDFSIVDAFQKVCDKAAELKGLDKVYATIVSGCRCDWHNGKEGGKSTSLHPEGRAIDFSIKGFKSGEIGDIIRGVLNPNSFDYYLITDKNVHLEFDPK